MLRTLVTRKYSTLVFTLLALLLALPSVWTGWQLDDLNIRYFLLGNPGLDGKPVSHAEIFTFLTGDPQRARQIMDIGLTPWWTLETMRLSFWRPLSSATHWLDYALWPDSAVMMHLHSLLWLGILTLIAAALYRRFMGPWWAAGLALLFFAIDDTHGVPAGWIANRNALIASVFGLLALLAHDRWRRDNWRPGAILGPAFLVLGIFSGEFALGIIGYLAAYQIFIDPGSPRQRLMSFLPYAALVCVWLVGYNLAGFGTWGSGFYVNPMSEPLAFMEALLVRGPLLLADQLALPPTSLVLFLPSAVVTGLWVVAVVLLIVLALALIPLIRHDPVARFWASGMLLSLPPICATMPHSRLLLLAGLGGAGLVAQWIVGFKEGADWLPASRGWRSLGRIVLVLFIATHLIIAPILFALNAVSPANAEPFIQTASASAPVSADIARHDLILVNPPNVFYGHSFNTARVVNDQTPSLRLRILASGAMPLHIVRTDERTLVVRPEGGFLTSPFDDVFRGSAYPLRLGESIELTNMTVVVTGLTGDGRPAEATFRFAAPLEDEVFEWLQWKDGAFARFELPPQGTGVILPAQSLF